MVMPLSIPAIGLVSVAIGQLYVRYWENLLRSADRNFDAFSGVTAHVFTDQPLVAEQISRQLTRVRVKVHTVPTLGWPDATMLRYKFFYEHAEAFSEDVLIYLDADMEIKNQIPASVLERCNREGALLVQHPGFYRPSGAAALLRFYVGHLGFLIRDFGAWLKYGGLGDWETRESSLAFVPRGQRRAYVCGGTWMARRDVFLSICGELSRATALDESRGIVAKWHDESHLNRYQATRGLALLEPSWCFVENAKNLVSLQPVIVAVDKGSNRVR